MYIREQPTASLDRSHATTNDASGCPICCTQLSTVVDLEQAAKGQRQPTQRNASEVHSPADAADELWPDDSPPDARGSPQITNKRLKGS